MLSPSIYCLYIDDEVSSLSNIGVNISGQAYAYDLHALGMKIDDLKKYMINLRRA